MTQKAINKKRIRPFIPLSNVLSKEFKKLCKRLLFLIRENGISRIEPNLDNREEWLTFAKYVHEGWKEAQSIIIDRTIRNLNEIDILKAEYKDACRSKDRPLGLTIKNKINALQVENSVMRRMIDSIAWAMLHFEHSTIRRLIVKGAHTNFSAQNIKDSIPTLSLYNQNDHHIAICCDLTTFIHVGDILLYDAKNGRTLFVELKSGDKNIALSGLATIAIEAKCKAFENELKKELSETDNKHFERLRKQAKVGKTVVDTINNEKGTDHNTGAGVTIFPTTYEPQSYSPIIKKCYEQLSDTKSWAIETVDECLHIGIYNNNDQAFVGFNAWMDLIGCKSQIYNIMDSFRIPTSTPFASLSLPTELLEKMILGEISLILCLDIKAFVYLANSMFPNFFSYASKKITAKADQEYTQPLKLEGKAVQGPEGAIIGQGVSDRILFDLLTPKQALKMLKQMMDGREEDQ